VWLARKAGVVGLEAGVAGLEGRCGWLGRQVWLDWKAIHTCRSPVGEQALEEDLVIRPGAAGRTVQQGEQS
jgi:hypothetical protein